MCFIYLCKIYSNINLTAMKIKSPVICFQRGFLKNSVLFDIYWKCLRININNIFLRKCEKFVFFKMEQQGLLWTLRYIGLQVHFIKEFLCVFSFFKLYTLVSMFGK